MCTYTLNCTEDDSGGQGKSLGLQGVPRVVSNMGLYESGSTNDQGEAARSHMRAGVTRRGTEGGDTSNTTESQGLISQ